MKATKKKTPGSIISAIAILVMLSTTIIVLVDVTLNTFKAPNEFTSIAIITLLILILLKDFFKMFPRFKRSKKKMKIGLDIHGVCDANPEFFVKLSQLFVREGHEVHILTGRRRGDGALEEIKELGLSYTHFFSIADHHEEVGTKMYDDKNGNPWMSDEDWDKTKGVYCKEHKIDFHIDDTSRYAEYFETPFAHIDIKKDEK